MSNNRDFATQIADAILKGPDGAVAVTVPAEGEWFVRNGRVMSVAETDLVDPGDEYWTYTVYVPTEEADHE